MNFVAYTENIFSIKGKDDFNRLAIEVFRYQSIHNKVYKVYLSALKTDPDRINSISEIPFLPVEFFKSHAIITGDNTHEKIYLSSGTTSDIVSKHYIKDVALYEDVFTKTFVDFYGNPSDFVILALLPSYLEREHSSLIYMMQRLINKSENPLSGFYLNELDKLFSSLLKLREQNQKTLLFGVTFALLDFIAAYPIDFPELIVMETGGMKGRRKEMVREEVHDILSNGFRVENIHSEYGMTELLSQAYSMGKGIFKSPPWMEILIRDPYDPFAASNINTTGGVNIIDLANIHSCSFIATQDLGRIFSDGSFEILGRFDFSDVRGCNLLVD